MMKKKIIRHIQRHKESPRYVLVNSPTYLRKDILTDALDVVKLLKDFDNFKTVRSQRLTLQNNLKVLMYDIHDSFLSLHRKLPIDESLKLELHRTEMPIRSIEIQKLKEFHRDLTDEDKIRDEIRQVESRLRRMNI